MKRDGNLNHDNKKLTHGQTFSMNDIPSFQKTDTLKMKGIAICLLLFHHLFYSMDFIITNGVEVHLISLNTLSQIATGARVCVWIFAFLSAYGLTMQYTKTDVENWPVKTFVKKYWLGIMKPYWFVWFISYFLSFFIFRNPVELYQKNIIYMALDFGGGS